MLSAIEKLIVQRGYARKRFYKATFFFLLGLATGLAISWTSFIESVTRLVIALADTKYGSWITALTALCVITVFLVPKLLASVTRIQEKCFVENESRRKEIIRDTVKIVMLELKREEASRQPRKRGE